MCEESALWHVLGKKHHPTREFQSFVVLHIECNGTDFIFLCRTSFALSADVRHLARRLTQLEQIVASSNTYGSQALRPLQSQPESSASQTPIPQESPNTSNHRSYTGGYLSTITSSDRGEFGRRPSNSHSDTEDAATGLENVLFGARVPVLRAINATSTSALRQNNFSTRGNLELTSALTSIIADRLMPDQDGRPRSAVRLGLDLGISTADILGARSGSMRKIFAVLPGVEIANYLILKVSEWAMSLRNTF